MSGLLILLSVFGTGVSGQTCPYRVHDPVMIKTEEGYYVFATGRGIHCLKSTNLSDWQELAPVFSQAPQWAKAAVPGFRGHIWAPDISCHDGIFYLYYSVSQFGKNTSCIGVATNTTLDQNSQDYHWIDHGKVVQSVPGRDRWNAIDPNLIVTNDSIPWLCFGSFWDGIKMVKLSPDKLSLAQPEVWHSLARRNNTVSSDPDAPGDGAIEAPFIFRKNGWYYLFVSWDYCCRGAQSTYKIIVGRSKEITGPYIDHSGVGMEQGGGTLLLEGNQDWYGVGHNSVYTYDGKDYLLYHAYDAHDNGAPKLQIRILAWDDEKWPVVKD